MATYNELFNLRRENTDLLNRVEVAAVKKAQTLIDAASPTAAQVGWALTTITAPRAEADRLLNYVLAANSALTVAQITAASDAAIQTAVNAAVDKIIAAGV
jgi:hypothetical protein